jgi:hypothetical protein
MDFWNNDITFVTQKKWKMWIQKNAKVIFKLKQKTKHYQMKNLLVKCIDIFFIYIIQNLKSCDCCEFLSLRIHFTF